MATKYVVEGDEYRKIDRKMRDIKRQLDQTEGSPLDPFEVMVALQCIVEGRFERSSAAGTAHVVYAIPAMKELRRRFPHFVDSDFSPDSHGIRFKPIKACLMVNLQPHEVEFRYAHFARGKSTDEALEEIDRAGLRPARVEELLAYDERYPKEMSRFPIIALGSTTDGIIRVACLDGGLLDRDRGLRLYPISTSWSRLCRFLCVRKEKSSDL